MAYESLTDEDLNRLAEGCLRVFNGSYIVSDVAGWASILNAVREEQKERKIIQGMREQKAP